MRVTLTALMATVSTAVLAAVAGQGCHQSSLVTQDRFPALYAQALCSSLQHCCAENGVTEDYAQCTKGWEAAVQALISGPNATGNFNATVAQQCIDQVNAASNVSCQPIAGSISDARGTCQSVFAGQLPTGAPCTSPAQCAPVEGSDVTCAVVPSDGGTGGSSGGGQLPLSAPSVSIQGMTVRPQDVAVCVANPSTPPTPGPCTSDAQAGTDTCTSGNYCDPASKTCMAIQPAGGPCNPDVIASCQPGAFCTAQAGAGLCMPAGPVGSACTVPAQCDATGYCDTGSGACVAILQPGASCSSSSQCSVGECDPSTHACLTNAIATTAACNGQVAVQ